MLMYPKEYVEFSQQLKRYVVLHIMIRVIEYDKKIIQQSNCKLTRVYGEILSEIQLKIEFELRQIKRRMKELGGSIIEEQQQPTVRVVKAKFRGFIYTHRFLNYLLQAESEKQFKALVLENKDKLMQA